MRKTILILLLFLSAHHLYSQQDSVLKNFKFRINTYRAITFNAGGGSQFSNNKLVTGTHKNNSSGGNFGASYYTVKSTDRIILSFSGGAGLSFSSSNAKDPASTNKNRSFSTSPQFSVLNRWFSKKMFTELGADISASHNANKSSATSDPGPIKYKQGNYSIAVNMGIGKGRLENIMDMQNALWLYKTLQEENRLSRSLNADELNELGRTITLANNTRVLDFRKRTQFMLETTDKFFQQKDVLTIDDARYFTSLNDILFFAVNNPRLSGKEIFIRLTPAINQAFLDQINDPVSTNNEGKATNKSVLFSAGISKYIPVNLRHQNNYGLSLKLDYTSYHQNDKYFVSGSLTNQFDINTTIKRAGVNLFFQHAIYPNTRTVISFDLRSEGGYQDVEQEKSFFGMADLSGSLNYFISYRTRLTCGLGVAWQKNLYGYSYYQYLQQFADNIHLFANAGLQVNL
jgi:hypothetical protein